MFFMLHKIIEPIQALPSAAFKVFAQTEVENDQDSLLFVFTKPEKRSPAAAKFDSWFSDLLIKI